MGYWDFQPYVTVAEKKRRAEKAAQRLVKNGRKLEPVQPDGRKVAKTFWGMAWCKHIEGMSDYASRLPRGRSYLTNGMVVHLSIQKGVIEALVSGSELYQIQIKIKAISAAQWEAVKAKCTGQIESVVDLLKGKLAKAVMEHVTSAEEGMFPRVIDVAHDCSCPDSAWLCKHLAAVFYGIGTRLDSDPGLLFKLRGVDADELVCHAVGAQAAPGGAQAGEQGIAEDALAEIFGVEMAGEAVSPVEVKVEAPVAKVVAKAVKAKKKVVRKVVKKAAVKGKKAKDVSENTVMVVTGVDWPAKGRERKARLITRVEERVEG
jgi:uncharacterized Zn finger protein